MDNEVTPITGLDELDKHLDSLLEDPNLELIPKLFDDVELQLTDANIPPLIPRFLPRLTTLLKQYTQDPTVIVSLTVKLLRPVPFSDVFQLASPDELVQALNSPSPAANLLAMAVLHKAATSPEDVAILCNLPHLLSAFIHRWLAAPQVEVAQKGGKVLGDLLDIDCSLPPPPPPPRPTSAIQITNPPPQLTARTRPGQGVLWRLLLSDNSTTSLYPLLLGLISGHHPSTSGDAHQLSLAQGRVLRLLPRLAALDFAAVTRSDVAHPVPAHFTNVNGNGINGDSNSNSSSSSGNNTATEDDEIVPPAIPNPPRHGEGLLQYAALRMVQKSDPLMHLSLVDFFEALVSLLRVAPCRTATEAGAGASGTEVVETLRVVLAEAMAGDQMLREALLSLPDRTVEEEAEDLKRWLGDLLPGEMSNHAATSDDTLPPRQKNIDPKKQKKDMMQYMATAAS
ncbi:hypothetical protein VTJ49DRAFT_5547 [Mycothermus thermophilus]|uniref:DNA mismatch repair protein HSM3 N-terminal domain-containing protein n=1 Tax=Humicola insolens TaxID=85995 RepID=A0ABR3V340_HUMIN